jgi:hypothetical protein
MHELQVVHLFSQKNPKKSAGSLLVRIRWSCVWGIVRYPDMIEVGFRDEIQALKKQTRTGSNYPRRAIIDMHDPHFRASPRHGGQGVF